jgi:serine/threonine-protein kinase
MRERHDNAAADRAPSKQSRVDLVIADLLERRQKGEVVSEERLSAAHPDLQPELDDALHAVRAIRMAVADARLAGPAADPIHPLSLSQLDEPLEVGNEAASAAPDGGDDASGEDFFPVEGGPAVDPRLSIEGFDLLDEVSEAGGCGQARVFKARQVATERIVAVKVFHGGPYLGSRARKRYWREVHILGKLNHPNIVGVLNRARTADGSFFLVMDFVEGERLDAYLDRRRGVLDQRQVVGLLLKIVDAVAEAHRKGIVHRDLKPSNIRVDGRGEPHVLDFGLARLLNEAQGKEASVTASGYLLGTLLWASPEQAEGDNDRVREPSDVYSLGVIMYRLLTGRFPYPVELPPLRVIESIRDREPAAPSAASDPPFGHVDLRLEAILLKALSKRPEDRYGNAGELGDELRRYLGNRPVQAPPRRTWRRRLRHPVSLILLAAAAVSSGAAYYATRPPPPPIVMRLRSEVNRFGMTMVDVPSGYLVLDGPVRKSSGATEPRRIPVMHPFAISKTEVTRKQYAAVMGLPVPSSDEEDLPVDRVSWDEATAFCDALSAKERMPYRLPTEVEWQYVSGAGRGTAYGGNGHLDTMGWHAGNGGSRLHPVGSKYPNDWGVHDMHGNVEEWCLDAARLEAGTAAALEVSALNERVGRVRRGGSVYSQPADCTSAARNFAPRESERVGLGFRVVRGGLPPVPNG